MKHNFSSMKKAAWTAGIIGSLLIVSTGLSILLSGGFDRWVWCGLPSLPSVLYYSADNYPGHGLECYRLNKMIEELPKPDEANPMTDERPLEITDGGLHFAGLHLEIGEPRKELRHKLRYGMWRVDAEQYCIGCPFCGNEFYQLDFEYDGSGQLARIRIEYWNAL